MKQTKKQFLFAVLLSAISATTFAQPSLGPKITNQGLGAEVGFLWNNRIDLEITTNGISGNNETAKIHTLSAGYRILFTHEEELNNYSLTPSIGYGLYRIKNFTPYNNDPTGKTGPEQINTNYPFVSMHLAKDMHIGQLYIDANICKSFYYGIGFRVYFYRKLLIQN